jgi:antitoxin component YwqK of YwqJK toxin-antitoxin module
MRKYLLFFLLAVALQLNAQQYLKDYELTSYKHTLTYADHKVVLMAQQSNTVLKKVESDKKYYWIANHEIRSTQGGYSGKLLHGLYLDYYLNNALKEQGLFNMGLKDGNWKSWTEEGVLLAEINFKNGVEEGNFYTYTAIGQLKEAGNYKKGKIDGSLKKYITQDSTVIVKYKNGVVQNDRNWIKNLLAKTTKAKSKN